MIIFDLDGVLADCEHRRHFIQEPPMWIENPRVLQNPLESASITNPEWYNFKSDWKSFYEACDKDKPIREVVNVFRQLALGWKTKIMIWSGRCESVRQKTQDWLFYSGIGAFNNESLKMRPIGDTTPDDQLKDKWLDEYLLLPNMDIANCPNANSIEFVFDSDPKSIAMWKRRGIFVLNCCQEDKEF